MKLLKNTDLDGTCYIQLSITNDEKASHWDERSIYFEEDDFQLYSKVLFEIDPQFNYFGPNKYPVGKKNELIQKLEELKDEFIKSNSSEVLKSIISTQVEDATLDSSELINSVTDDNFEEIKNQIIKLISDTNIFLKSNDAKNFYILGL